MTVWAVRVSVSAAAAESTLSAESAAESALSEGSASSAAHHLVGE